MDLTHNRLHRLDALRGLALINMIAYHCMWDLVYLFGLDAPWYRSAGAHVWQQAICCTFIVLSGFCQPMGRRSFKRGAVVFGAGGLLSLVTLAVMPSNRVIFGVLTFLGSAMLLFTLLDQLLRRCPASVGLAMCLGMFLFTRQISSGVLGFGPLVLLQLPSTLYQNWFTTYLGLPMANFFSTDYFPLIPWVFLFGAGYYLNSICQQHSWMRYLRASTCPALEWIGRHSLVIYLLHQPVVYGVLSAVSFIKQLSCLPCVNFIYVAVIPNK
ncbi:heparan-alpha-glucosaminide N-acetyltransferase domain-containing protein [uncultured Allofournierella sp.]|uniref:heparan-alpha-glucosaminide N-acetyltransferase domain-containing protein n=1 Tax=uncultured Allofournierella sp. TaxID=1940258 RepID=UPI0037537739